MYVCGPTVYGDPHVGHGRFNLIWDIIRRYLTWSGLDVDYVSNMTDIDDKIINLANAEGRPADEVAVHYGQCGSTPWPPRRRPPTKTPHATEYVDDMLELIAELIDRARPTRRRRRLLLGPDGRGLRPAGPPAPRQPAGGRPGPGDRGGRQAEPHRLRPLEVRQAGRAPWERRGGRAGPGGTPSAW